MKSLFAKLGALLAAVRVWTVNILTLLVLVYVVVVVVAVMRQSPGSVDPDGRVLILNPTGVIRDQAVYPNSLSPAALAEDQQQIQSRDLIRLIRAAAGDERLSGILLDFSNASFSGPSTALNIAKELAALRESGKPVIAYGESMTTASYLMAAQAGEVYVHPSGAVAISGVGGYGAYTRALTEKLKINIHNYSQGDYKSATEGLTRNDMSDADRLQRTELFQPIWEALKSNMAQARGVDAGLFQTIADDYPAGFLNEAAYDNLAFAEENGLIDGTMSFPEFRAYMIERFGKDEDEERDTYPHIVADAYAAQLEQEENGDDAVAVVFVEGVIQQGEIEPGVAGSDDVARLIRKAHENEDTRAIVLRVNSPGGSVIASDIIRDELVAASAKSLPVVVSMGDVAASGGMWVSTPADRILAEPTTITGSIGVAIAFPTLEDMFDHIGVHFDGVTTSEYAGWGLNKGVDERLDGILARYGSSIYQRFIDVVAQGRDREPDYIRSIAGGRVWLAGPALERGLVDELGTMEDAINSAAALAGVEDYRVNYVTEEPPFGLMLLQRMLRQGGVQWAPGYGAFGARVEKLFEIVENISQPSATLMCTECLIEVR